MTTEPAPATPVADVEWIDQPVSRILASFLAGTRYDDLPATAVAATKRAVLDWFGSALAGSREAPARIAREVVAGFGAADEATRFPDGRTSAAGAALTNGVAAHILELDDIHRGSTVHGAAPIVPAALAVAERERADGRAFLLAAALGYEAAVRVGEAVNPSHYRFWHPTGTAATFGSAAAAGSLLGLREPAMLHALGTAGTQAAGLWEFNADGAMSKHLHPGKAAFNGVLAADLAGRGFTGATRVLEGERGFFRATTAEYRAECITEALGARWKVEENGYKLHACCGHTHTAIDALLRLRDALGWSGSEALQAVKTLRIATYGPGYEIVKEPNPRTPYQAKFSLAYVAATALLEGRVGLEQFAPERFGPEGVTRPETAALLTRIQVDVDTDLSARYPATWPARVALTLADGRAFEERADVPLGHAEHPVALETLEAKARDLIAPRFDERFADRVVSAVRALDEATDMAALMREVMESAPSPTPPPA